MIIANWLASTNTTSKERKNVIEVKVMCNRIDTMQSWMSSLAGALVMAAVVVGP
jgi:hypothetical protein